MGRTLIWSITVLLATCSLAFGQPICDGTELLCLELTSAANAEASGGEVVGGDFNADGFQPSNQGGIDWSFGPETDLSWGRIEVDVKGLVPVEAGEQEGGKVSIFSLCGQSPQEKEGVGLQKMPPDYRDGHIFRFGMDDDDLADNWDAVIITGRDFGCYYSINDPAWQAGETHHFVAQWSRDGLDLRIDGLHCQSGGNGDGFDPANKIFTLANRCTHYANQHAVARFKNLRLLAASTGPRPDAGMQFDAGQPEGDDAVFVNQQVPSRLNPGQDFTATVTFRNTGTSTWTKEHFRLGSEAPMDNRNWGTNRIYLDQDERIEQGQSKSFSLSLTAPVMAGRYNFQWQMVHELVRWFGEKSPLAVVAVGDVAADAGTPQADAGAARDAGAEPDAARPADASQPDGSVAKPADEGPTNVAEAVAGGCKCGSSPAGAGWLDAAIFGSLFLLLRIGGRRSTPWPRDPRSPP